MAGNSMQTACDNILEGLGYTTIVSWLVAKTVEQL